jgi:aminopeptidase N
MFDDRLYKRGALTLHALRRVVGDAVFFPLLSSWASAHRHATVTTADFVRHATAASGAADQERVPRLLDAWLHGRALPELPA